MARKKTPPTIKINPHDYVLPDTNKTDNQPNLRKLDALAEAQGYVARQVRKRRSVPNPRTGQLHAKVLPQVYEEILL